MYCTTSVAETLNANLRGTCCFRHLGLLACPSRARALCLLTAAFEQRAGANDEGVDVMVAVYIRVLRGCEDILS